MRAYLNLRYSLETRRKAFESGLRRHGYTIAYGLPAHDPRDGDVLVTWNRVGQGEKVARRFESAGLPVLVAENATWGNDFAGQHWLHIARGRHNTAGMFPVGDHSRWDSLGVDLKPFRGGIETVVIAQRGIGSPPTSMPKEWPRKALKRHGGKIRPHPGRRPSRPLDVDLRSASRVITWGSGAAIKALMLGVPVISEMPDWIGEQDNTVEGRLAMFRRLAWAQWAMDEIASGEPFVGLM